MNKDNPKSIEIGKIIVDTLFEYHAQLIGEPKENIILKARKLNCDDLNFGILRKYLFKNI